MSKNTYLDYFFDSKRIQGKNGSFLVKNLSKLEREEACREGQNIIFEFFGIEGNNKANLFQTAIRGRGNEWKSITSLHSSSLCAFLHFCNVSEENPLTISLNDGTIKRNVVFEKVMFEFSMPCVGTGCSSMDIVLHSKNDKIVLFLESKFSEYFEDNRYTIKNKSIAEYSTKFDNLFPQRDNEGAWIIGDSLKAFVRNDTIILDNEHTYNSGLKQIICKRLIIRT